MTRFLKLFLPLIFLIVFLIPGYTFFVINQNSTQVLFQDSVDLSVRLLTLFRLFGLYAFTLVWGQIILGPFLRPLMGLYGARILQLHQIEGLLALILATLHPLLFYLGYLFSSPAIPPIQALQNYLGPDLLFFGYLGVSAYLLLLATVLSASLRNHPFFIKKWPYIHLLNYAVFVLVFVHSFKIGTEVRLDPLRILYLFYGITFVAAVIYKIGYRRIFLGVFKNQPT